MVLGAAPQECAMSTFYVTTPIYYVNGAPHLGHAYTTLVADAFARHYRQRNRDVFFLTGTDEHGLKVQRAAEKKGVSPQELCDENSAKFKDLFNRMNLTHDRFIRTTEEAHEEVVLDMVERMKDAGDIYLDKYEGWYSASDEAYYDDDEIEDGRAIASGSEVEWVEEDSYFFRLSDYEDDLLEWYDSIDGGVAPEARKNEVRSFVEGGLNDLSITRTSFDWGIEFPGDSDHVLYVWVDALTNYLTGVGRLHDSEMFEQFWPCDIHLVGKDILRFHAVYWPAFLMSAGVDLPEQVFAHGWWTVEGEKMSKSKGNWVDAGELVDTYDLDVVRYFLMRELPFGNDGNFARRRLVERNNTELADNYGNLVNRTTRMAESFLDGELPDVGEPEAEVDRDLRDAARGATETLREQMDDREPHRAIETAMELSGEVNQYLQETEPWTLNRDGQTERVGEVLYHALEGIRWATVLLRAFIPHTTDDVLEALGLDPESAGGYAELDWGGLESGASVRQPDVLFEKLEFDDDGDDGAPDTEQRSSRDTVEEEAVGPSVDREGANLVSFDEFERIEFRAGLIRRAEPVEDADQLLELGVDLGESEDRTVVAGLAASHDPEELKGLRVPFVTNLEPAEIFGIESQAMLLAASVADGGHALPTFDDSVEPGDVVA